MEFKEGGSPQQEIKKEAKRHRKKLLLKQLTEQMEFYFSPANLSKDKFMSELLAKDSFIDIETFFKFNKIRSLTMDNCLLKKSIKKSSLIHLSEDETKVSLKLPIQEKIDECECTIYIESLPAHVTHEWVRKVFTQYGVIDYVSIPRYKHSGRPKGFAFVEFQTPQMAKLALEAFGIKDYGKIQDIDPADLQSIKTYDGSDQKGTINTEVSENNTISITEDNLENEIKVDAITKNNSIKEKSPNKRKISEKEIDDEEEDGEEILESSEPTSKKIKKNEQNNSDENVIIGDEFDVMKKKKKKRKKAKVKEQESESIYLRVMSKQQWKSLRNKYLNLQRKNIHELKQNIKTSKYYYNESYYDSYDMYKHSDKEEKYDSYDMHKHADKEEKKGSDELNPTFCTKPKFIANVVLKISFEEPPPDPRKLRETIRNGGGENVAYVEVSSRESDIYVRFKSEISAKSYLNGGCWSRMEILKGDAEKKYWDHVILNWEERRAKRNKKDGCGGHGGISKNIRGKDKIVQKAFQVVQKAKPNSHVIFKD